MGHKLNSSGRWWAPNENTWFIKGSDGWYILKGAKQERPEDVKRNPISNTPSSRDDTISWYVFVLASVLGVSLALNVWYILSTINGQL